MSIEKDLTSLKEQLKNNGIFHRTKFLYNEASAMKASNQQNLDAHRDAAQ